MHRHWCAAGNHTPLQVSINTMPPLPPPIQQGARRLCSDDVSRSSKHLSLALILKEPMLLFSAFMLLKVLATCATKHETALIPDQFLLFCVRSVANISLFASIILIDLTYLERNQQKAHQIQLFVTEHAWMNFKRPLPEKTKKCLILL